MSDLVDPSFFLEWLHWIKPYLTEGEKRVVWQIRTGRQKRLGLDFIERVMFRAGATDQLHIFYPSDEMTCAHGHPWAENEVFHDGTRYCRACANYSKYLHRGPQLRLF